MMPDPQPSVRALVLRPVEGTEDDWRAPQDPHIHFGLRDSDWDVGDHLAMDVAFRRIAKQVADMADGAIAHIVPPLQLRAVEARLDDAEARIRELEARVEESVGQQPITTAIHSVAPEPFELLQPIPVVVQPTGDTFVASFLEANVNVAAETVPEAIEDLTAYILDLYETLEALAPERLGPEPSRQFAVLREFVGPMQSGD